MTNLPINSVAQHPYICRARCHDCHRTLPITEIVRRERIIKERGAVRMFDICHHCAGIQTTNLSAVLTDSQRAAGLWLQADEDFVHLKCGENELATFTHHAEDATIRALADLVLGTAKK